MLVPEFQYCAAVPVRGVGARFDALGPLESTLASALTVEAELWLPTKSEILMR